MFSPMVAIASAIAVSTVTRPTVAALILSMSAPTSSAICAIILTSPWNCSLRATKSVSELTSTMTPLVALVRAAIRPSAATRPAFFAAFDSPFFRSQSWAACMSPAVSVRAALQSIIPAPVDSRRSLTIAAVIVAIFASPLPVQTRRSPKGSAVIRQGFLSTKIEAGVNTGQGVSLFRFTGEGLGLRDPGVGAARQADLFADPMGGVMIELGELPVMEDSEIVELLLDRARHAGELLEIVGGAARAGEALE